MIQDSTATPPRASQELRQRAKGQAGCSELTRADSIVVTAKQDGCHGWPEYWEGLGNLSNCKPKGSRWLSGSMVVNAKLRPVKPGLSAGKTNVHELVTCAGGPTERQLPASECAPSHVTGACVGIQILVPGPDAGKAWAGAFWCCRSILSASWTHGNG